MSWVMIGLSVVVQFGTVAYTVYSARKDRRNKNVTAQELKRLVEEIHCHLASDVHNLNDRMVDIEKVAGSKQCTGVSTIVPATPIASYVPSNL